MFLKACIQQLSVLRFMRMFPTTAPLLRRTFFIAALFVCCVAPAALTAQRLSSSVVPQHYTLTLTPDLKAATFSGVESIAVTLKQPSSTITLNAAEIEFQSVTLSAADHTQTATVALNKDKEQAT